MQGLTQPELLLKPFAQNGTKNTIPVTNTDTTNPQKADLTNGFPAITSMEPDDGGLPPERADFNGLGYLTTTYDYFAQAGGKYTFNQTVSTAIGGYPLNARLWYFNGTESQILRSTKNNNDDNFVSNPSFIGTSWVKDTPTMTDLTTRVPASIGSIVKPVYTNANGTITASNATVGSSSQPVYMNNGTITALTGTIANNISGNAATVTNGVYTTGNQTIGGTKTFSNTISGNISGNAATATIATKLGTSTIGSGVKPIYLNGGTATASNSTVGSGIKPVYLSSGTITASGSSVGSTRQPVYMSNGTITACDSLSTVLGAVYPVGSIYIGTQASCPLASLISGSTWVKDSSAILTSVSGNAPVKLNSTNAEVQLNFGIKSGTSNRGKLGIISAGSNIYSVVEQVTGEHTDTIMSAAGGETTSGLYGDLSSSISSLSVNVWRRTA